MFARRLSLLAIVLLLVIAGCGEQESPQASPAAGVAGATTVVPTATLAASPTPTLTPSPTPLPAFAVPAGTMTVRDPAGDVEDVQLQPVPDARPFVDLAGATLTIDATTLTLALDAAGPVPETLEAGEEMWWAFELSSDRESLHRVTVILSGSTWQTTDYDFEHAARLIPARMETAGSRLTIAIPLAELPKLDGPFRWYAVAIWGGFNLDREDVYADRLPNGDPLRYPEGSGPVLPTWEDLPAAAAPLGLGDVALPADEAGFADLIARLPEEVAGLPRARDLVLDATGAHPAVWGTQTGAQGLPTFELYLAALDTEVPFSDWSPGTTGREVIAFFASGIDSTVDAAGRDGDLGWVRSHGLEPSLDGATRQVYSLVWAEAGSHWYVSARADSPDHLDALVTAFVATAQPAATP